MPPKPKLYALLVAINDYCYPVGRLSGCVSDIRKVKKYLEGEKESFDVHIKMLLNEEATRDGIIKGFREHLGSGGKNDVAFFYYSGHGAQEQANEEIWRFEPDKKLEGLVCYDSISAGKNGYKLLADKELRYLIHQVSTMTNKGGPKEDSPHIITIFDCCHSGENTRNLYILQEEGEKEDLKERRFQPDPEARMSPVLPERKWEHFLFADESGVTREALKTKHLTEVLPQAKHIQLSGCRSDESSYEKGGEGIFTKNLIKVLTDSQRSVTYYDLRNRLNNYIKNQFKQTPQIYEAAGSSDIYKVFLNKSGGSKPMYGNIVYNESEGWFLDMGALHGISKQAEAVKVLSLDEKDSFTAKVGKVSSSDTQLLFDEKQEKKLDRSRQYLGFVEGFLSAPVNVYINNRDQNEEAEAQLKKLLEKESKNINCTEQERGADYSVQMLNGRYVITLPGDPYRPLVMPAPNYQEDSVKFTHSYLHHISQWEYVKNLHNTESKQLSQNTVKVELFKVLNNGKLELIETDAMQEKDNDTVKTEFSQISPGEYGGKIRIKLSNTSEFPVFVSLLYLSRSFEVYPGLLANSVQQLEPLSDDNPEGGTVWVFDGDDVELDYEKSVEIFNWEESLNYFKLIISREPFDVGQFVIPDLPDPALLLDQTRGERGIKKLRKAKNAEANAWTTRLISLRISNPNYNKMPKEKLDALLQTDAAEFIRGLYPAGFAEKHRL